MARRMMIDPGAVAGAEGRVLPLGPGFAVRSQIRRLGSGVVRAHTHLRSIDGATQIDPG